MVAKQIQNVEGRRRGDVLHLETRYLLIILPKNNKRKESVEGVQRISVESLSNAMSRTVMQKFRILFLALEIQTRVCHTATRLINLGQIDFTEQLPPLQKYTYCSVKYISIHVSHEKFHHSETFFPSDEIASNSLHQVFHHQKFFRFRSLNGVIRNRQNDSIYQISSKVKGKVILSYYSKSQTKTDKKQILTHPLNTAAESRKKKKEILCSWRN